MNEPFYILSEKDTEYGKIIEIGVDVNFDLTEHKKRFDERVAECKKLLIREKREAIKNEI